jgi:hypothetical protein
MSSLSAVSMRSESSLLFGSQSHSPHSAVDRDLVDIATGRSYATRVFNSGRVSITCEKWLGLHSYRPLIAPYCPLRHLDEDQGFPRHGTCNC